MLLLSGIDFKRIYFENADWIEMPQNGVQWRIP
jgi:hypothetical protein